MLPTIGLLVAAVSGWVIALGFAWRYEDIKADRDKWLHRYEDLRVGLEALQRKWGL